MAVDTRNKRASSIGVGNVMTIFPNPDGAITQPDRQQSARTYSGVQASGGVTPPPGPTAVSGRKGKLLAVLMSGGGY